MTKNKVEQLAVWLALGAGGLDFCTGLGLVFWPEGLLRLMLVAAPGAEATIYLRWVGAFVAAVGFTYLWTLWRRDVALLRHALELTIWFRLAAGGYSVWAIATGSLPLLWLSVPVTDFFLAGAQAWMLRRGVFKHGN